MKNGFFFAFWLGSVALAPVDVHARKDKTTTSEPASFKATPNTTHEDWLDPVFQKSYVAFSKNNPLAWHQYARDRQKELADPTQDERWALFEQQRPAYLTWLEKNPKATKYDKQDKRKELIETESTEAAQAKSEASEAWIHALSQDKPSLHKAYETIETLLNSIHAYEADRAALIRHLQDKRAHPESRSAPEEDQNQALANHQRLLAQQMDKIRKKKRALADAKPPFVKKHLAPEQRFLDALTQQYERDLNTLTQERRILDTETIALFDRSKQWSLNMTKAEKNKRLKQLDEGGYKTPITKAIEQTQAHMEALATQRKKDRRHEGVSENVEGA